MKKIIFIFSLYCIAFAWSGCDDLLNVTPETDFTDENFWKTEGDLKGASIRLYQQLPYNGPDTRGDEFFNTSGPNSFSTGIRQIPYEDDNWTNNYRCIFTANNIIEKGANTPVNENIRNRYLGEARFFRAWYYFDLVCKFGDVPLVLKSFTGTTDPDLKMPRTPREIVIQQCYDDLAFAAEWLPTRAAMESVTNEFERRFVTRSAALGLIVRIGLREGTMLKFHNLGNETLWKAHLQKSIDAYNLLKSEGHQLYSVGGPSISYLALFIDESNASNKETIFGKAYGPNHNTNDATSVNHSYTSSLNDRYVSRRMIDTYLYADGLPRDKTNLAVTPELSFNHVFGYERDGITPIAGGMGARDPRLNLTFWRNNDPQDTEQEVVAGARISWYYTGKRVYYIPLQGYTPKKGFIGECYYWDWTDRILIRWGEMLISYAEALYEINGSITDAQLDETVNALRARVGFNVMLTNAFITTHGLDMREEIRRERTVELMSENFRYNDLIRWKTAETVMTKAITGIKFVSEDSSPELLEDPTFVQRLTDATGKINGVQEYDYPEGDIYILEKSTDRRFNPAKDYYYPIPVFEISQSGGSIVQNPEWY